MKIKVLHIIKSLGRGGAETLLPETLKFHDHSKFEFQYIYFLPWKNQLVAKIKSAGGKVVNLRAGNNILILLNTLKLARYARKQQIDIIHCHLPWAGFAGRIVHLLTRTPVIYTEHNKQERYHPLTRVLNKWSFNLQTMAVAVSQDVAASIHKNIRPRISVTAIPNGVDSSFFKRGTGQTPEIRNRYGLGEEKIVIGTVAVFRSQKRLDRWLDIFHKLSSQYPCLSGLIVGDGPLRKAIRDKIIELNLEDRVLMPGLQSEVKPWLEAMDIFMMSSEFEGMPIALLEAMSMECAIVATNAGGVGEVVRHGVDGLLVPVSGWEELAVNAETLIGNALLRSELGKRARQRVVDRYSIGSMAGELEKVYASLCARADKP